MFVIVSEFVKLNKSISFLYTYRKSLIKSNKNIGYINLDIGVSILEKEDTTISNIEDNGTIARLNREEAKAFIKMYIVNLQIKKNKNCKMH